MALTLFFSQNIFASGYSSETVAGVGLGVDFHGTGENPVYSGGLLYGAFGYLSYHARLAVSHRPADKTTFVRAGVGLGFIAPLINIDLTQQSGAVDSAGMFFGLSGFVSGASFTPEIYAGYQVNFNSAVENYFLAGVKAYYNFGN